MKLLTRCNLDYFLHSRNRVERAIEVGDTETQLLTDHEKKMLGCYDEIKEAEQLKLNVKKFTEAFHINISDQTYNEEEYEFPEEKSPDKATETISDSMWGSIRENEESFEKKFYELFFKDALIENMVFNLQIQSDEGICNCEIHSSKITIRVEKCALYETTISKSTFIDIDTDGSISTPAKRTLFVKDCVLKNTSFIGLQDKLNVETSQLNEITIKHSQFSTVEIGANTQLNQLNMKRSLIHSLKLVNGSMAECKFESNTIEHIDIRNFKADDSSAVSFSEITFLNLASAKILASPTFQDRFRLLKLQNYLTIMKALKEGKPDVKQPLLILLPYSMDGSTANADKLVDILSSDAYATKNFFIFVSNTGDFNFIKGFFIDNTITPDLCVLPGGENVPKNYFSDKRTLKMDNGVKTFDVSKIEEEASPFDDPRTNFELRMLDWCVNERIPVIGICRGLQLMGVYFGNEIIDAPEGHSESSDSHTVIVPKRIQTTDDTFIDNPLYKALKSDASTETSDNIELKVSCQHHQAVKKHSDSDIDFKTVATSKRDTGVIEAVEFELGQQGMVFKAVQNHPESIIDSKDGRYTDEDTSDSHKVLRWLLTEGKKRASERLADEGKRKCPPTGSSLSK